MREQLHLTALVLSLVLVLGATIAVGHQEVASIDATVSKKKLPKKKSKPVGLTLSSIFQPEADGSAPTPTGAAVDFGRNLRVFPGAAPLCAADLAGTTEAEAEQRCGDAKLSEDAGSAFTVTGATPAGSGTLSGPLKVFNGPSSGDVRIWARLDAFDTTVVIDGRIGDTPRTVSDSDAKLYRKRLTLAIPDLEIPDGVTLERAALDVAIAKSGLIKARCRDRRQRFRLVADYSDHERTTSTDADRCKRA